MTIASSLFVIPAVAGLSEEAVQMCQPCMSGGCSIRPQDEMWLISTRHLGCPVWHGDDTPQLEVLVYRHEGGWTRSSLAEFLAADSESTKPITAIYVHGNREDAAGSRSSGESAYGALVRGAEAARPIRFVIWSWPSDQVRGPLRDIRTKAARSDSDAYYLGWLLSQMDPRSPVCLIGYSYGARIVLGGLHLSTGGQLCGKSLTLSSTRPISRVRVVVFAAAEHNYWMIPGQRHDRAYLRIGHMLALYNSCDPVLTRYRWVDPYARPEAMGYTGVAGRGLLADGGQRIDQFNVCCQIGRTHNDSAYFSSPGIVREMRRHVFWEPMAK